MDKLPKLPPVEPIYKPTETISVTCDPPESGDYDISIDDALETITVIINGVQEIVNKEEEEEKGEEKKEED